MPIIKPKSSAYSSDIIQLNLPAKIPSIDYTISTPNKSYNYLSIVIHEIISPLTPPISGLPALIPSIDSTDLSSSNLSDFYYISRFSGPGILVDYYINSNVPSFLYNSGLPSLIFIITGLPSIIPTISINDPTMTCYIVYYSLF